MRVALFITCLSDTFFPQVGVAVVRVLRHFGCRVEFPAGQTCCGQPAWTAGFPQRMAELARRMITVFAEYEWVVTPSASCANTVRTQFADVLANDPAAARAARELAERTYEFGEFLEKRLAVDVGALIRQPEPLTMHYPCHARHVYSVEQLQRWLGGANAPHLRPPAHVDLCCGFGGSFAVDYPEISAAMLHDRLAELRATGCGDVVCNEGGCSLNLMGGAHRAGLALRFRHMAEIIEESLGLAEKQT